MQQNDGFQLFFLFFISVWSSQENVLNTIYTHIKTPNIDLTEVMLES